jgi:hypothetical protein
MRIVIGGTNLPGRSFECGPDGSDTHRNVFVGIGVGTDAVMRVPGDAASARWEIEVRTVRVDDGGIDFRGEFVNGRRGDRFVYLSWGNVDGAGNFAMFRRAKIGLSTIDQALAEDAVGADRTLECSVALTDARGGPRCARIPVAELSWLLTG